MTRECLVHWQRSFFSVPPRQRQKTAHFSVKVFGKEILDTKSPRRNITVNLLSRAKSDHHQISPCNINAESVVVTRIMDMITRDEFV